MTVGAFDEGLCCSSEFAKFREMMFSFSVFCVTETEVARVEG
jgi:hypothetical protein